MDLICSKESGGSPGWHQSCGKGEIEVQIGHFSWLWPGNHNHSSVLLLLSLRKLVDIQFLMSTKKLTRDKGRPYQGASLVCHSRWSVTLPFLRTNNQDCEAEAHACPEHDAFQPWKIHILLHTFDIFLKKCVMLLDFVGTCRHYILQPVFICAWSNHRKLTTSTLLMMCDLSLVLSLPERRIHFPSWLYSSGHPGYCHFFLSEDQRYTNLTYCLKPNYCLSHQILKPTFIIGIEIFPPL